MNTTSTIDTSEASLGNFYVVKTANDWLRQSKNRPVPKMLFGEFWLEGELGVLFADTGKGKSLLAVQIAESIARGAPIAPLQMTAPAQSVLYLDLELSDKQFEMRYAGEHDAEEGEFLTNHYEFSDNLYRVEIDAGASVPDGFRSFDEILPRIIEKLTRETGSRVVIIDNITCLQRSVYGSRETLELMKELKRLKRSLGLSILVLAHAPKRETARPITGGVQGERLLSRFADNVFTIGQSKLDTAGRYIKHIRSSSTEIMYDKSHVPSFRVTRIADNFLGFEHQAFAPERVHLQDVRDHRDWPTIDKIKGMSDTGKSIREIAAELELPKTSVHRMLQMWTPEISEPSEPREFDPKPDPLYFPGRDEYNQALADPRFYSMYSREDAADYALRREYCLIDDARAAARKEYLKTGKAPILAEMLARNDALSAAESEPGAVATGLPGNGSEPVGATTGSLSPLDSQLSTQNPMHGLKLSYDGYGHEIFVEKEAYDGKPVIWYNFDSKGRKKRWERKCNGIFGGLTE